MTRLALHIILTGVNEIDDIIIIVNFLLINVLLVGMKCLAMPPAKHIVFITMHLSAYVIHFCVQPNVGRPH